MNRRGHLHRWSRRPEIGQLVRGSQRQNSPAQLLIVFDAVVDLRRYAKTDLASIREGWIDDDVEFVA